MNETKYKIPLRIIGVSIKEIRELKEKLEKEKVRVYFSIRESADSSIMYYMMGGGFSDIVLILGGMASLLKIAEIIRNWINEKKKENPKIEITNHGQIDKIEINLNGDTNSISKDLEKIGEIEKNKQSEIRKRMGQ